jgi:hypothetical protein
MITTGITTKSRANPPEQAARTKQVSYRPGPPAPGHSPALAHHHAPMLVEARCHLVGPIIWRLLLPLLWAKTAQGGQVTEAVIKTRRAEGGGRPTLRPEGPVAPGPAAALPYRPSPTCARDGQCSGSGSVVLLTCRCIEA